MIHSKGLSCYARKSPGQNPRAGVRDCSNSNGHWLLPSLVSNLYHTRLAKLSNLCYNRNLSRYKTFSYRIKDSTESFVASLLEKARAVNFVWNFCNETQQVALNRGHRWPSGFDLNYLTAGSAKDLGINSTTVQAVGEEYAKRRKSSKKSKLKWRSRKRSLAWIPFKFPAIKINQALSEATYCGLTFGYFNSRPMEGVIKTGSICCDSRGRWYLNLTCELADFCGPVEHKEIGIDLGLKDVVTTSNGLKIKAVKYFKQYENKLAQAQRAGKKRLVRTIHAKIKNRRKDFNHKLSTGLASEFTSFIVGDVSATGLKNSGNQKSIHDASWYQLKTFLKYKALARGSSYREVSEAYSTQMCAECGCIPKSSPKGKKDLNVREWVCSECGSINDRDINAAKNILRFGHESPQIKALIKRKSKGIL